MLNNAMKLQNLLLSSGQIYGLPTYLISNRVLSRDGMYTCHIE